MRCFLGCLLYLALIGIIFFLIGRILPKEKFSYEKFPFRSFSIEKDGRIYNSIGIRKWKNGFPDMSRILPVLIPSKKLPIAPSSEQIKLMIQETCIAEFIHSLLSLLGFGCVFIWKSLGGWIISGLYMIGNLPYIIIQRYNRPKLVKLLHSLRVKEGKTQTIGYHYGKAGKKWNRKMIF